jgi:hypothetical protein
MIRLLVAIVGASLTALGAEAAHNTSRPKLALSESLINSAAPNERNDNAVLIIKAEVLLDRGHFSPGQIDGKDGENFRKAVTAFQQANNLPPTSKIDSDTWKALTANVSGPVLKRYTISADDVAGPFDRRIPHRLEQMARQHGLSCRDPLEELSEKFHTSEDLLRTLNPTADFDRAGTTIAVPDVQPLEFRHGAHTIEAARPKSGETEGDSVTTVVVDKPARDVRAYGKDGRLLAFFPATIGSEEKPAPTGTFWYG